MSAFEGKKVLIAYYTASGTTGNVARYIKEFICHADELSIETIPPYPKEYDPLCECAKKDLDHGVLPKIVSNGNVSNYDVIFLGSPCWSSRLSCPVSSFLASADFHGKIIIPFITHGGSGMASTVSDIKKYAPGAKIVGGRAFGNPVWVRGFTRNDVERWIQSIKL
ncbi:flavodoxin [Histomonas meleagridis]|uniref:flavodoxin n=1 Tax=Histomonas meleagridis TaxID=135588 RepID=UPI003559AF3E|nr:flavodoxin [Histomonas meleagridis]KAH0802958.1 flavodoxin [Histomonas meleagridis]